MRKILILFSLVILSLLAYKFFFAQENNFPYGSTKSEILISEQKNSPGSKKDLIYNIKTGDIEGEAIFTNVSSTQEGDSLVHWNSINAKSAFKTTNAPYAGQVTANITCEAENL